MSDRKMGFMDLRLDLNYLKFVRNLPKICRSLFDKQK